MVSFLMADGVLLNPCAALDAYASFPIPSNHDIQQSSHMDPSGRTAAAVSCTYIAPERAFRDAGHHILKGGVAGPARGEEERCSHSGSRETSYLRCSYGINR